jgi:hypothetical protein
MIHVELDLDHDNFFCPATGHQILGGDTFEPSPATEFVFTNESGEFEHIAPKWEQLDKQVNTDEAMEDDPWERFQRFAKAIDEPKIVVFTITTSGIACGPVSSTVHIGINMNFKA